MTTDRQIFKMVSTADVEERIHCSKTLIKYWIRSTKYLTTLDIMLLNRQIAEMRIELQRRKTQNIISPGCSIYG